QMEWGTAELCETRVRPPVLSSRAYARAAPGSARSIFLMLLINATDQAMLRCPVFGAGMRRDLNQPELARVRACLSTGFLLVWPVEAIKPHSVAADHLFLLVRRHVQEVFFDDPTAIGPIILVVRVVGRPHHIVHTDGMPVQYGKWFTNERAHEIAPEILRRRHFQL